MTNKILSKTYAEAFRLSQTLGMSVIPVNENKIPLLPSWKQFQDRIATPEELEAWWTKWPSANVGIVTGKISGITVVDVDTHAGASAAPFPATYTVKTGNGGLQLYYKYSPGYTISANQYPQFPHVDMRNDGGFVVAPPSQIKPKTEEGKKREGRYEVIDPQPFAEFPTHLFPANSRKRRRLTDLVDAKPGERNDTIASAIGTILFKLDADKFNSDGWQLIQKINETYKPPLPIHELETTFKSIAEKELARRDLVGQATPSPIQIGSEERISILLRKSASHIPFKDMNNAYLVLEQHPQTKGQIRYNEFRQEIEYKGQPFEEGDLIDLVYMMQGDTGLNNITKDAVYSAVQRYAYKNKYDEAVDWLKTLEWDGVNRLEQWLTKATGVDDDEYHRTIGMNWWCGMVRRMVYPGCIFDHVLVAVGPQGLGKTGMFRIIGGPWYKSYTGAMDNKDFFLTLRGACLIDLDEGVAMYRSEAMKMKTMITQTVDEFRAPYDRTTKKYPRRFAFSMSTNDSEPFRDTTGNRRYWPVDLKKKVDFIWLEDNRDQLFAEAYHMILNNLTIPEVPAQEVLERQQAHLPEDEWSEPIQDWLQENSGYCKGDPDFNIKIVDIFNKVLKGDKLDRLDHRHSIRIGRILKTDCGMEKRRIRDNGNLQYRYFLTPQRCEELAKTPLGIKLNELDAF